MIVLDHFLVRCRDKEASARFLGDLLEVPVSGPEGPFMAVRVNEDRTIEFDDRNEFAEGHCAFLVDDQLFDRVLRRIRAAEIPFGGSPETGWNQQIGTTGDGRRVVYVRDPDGNTYEFLTPAH